LPRYHEALLAMHRRYGPLVRERIGRKTIVHVFSPDDIQTVYAAEGKWPVVPPLQVGKRNINSDLIDPWSINPS